MRRVANGHPSALVIERCQPGSRFTWWGVPVRGKIPADCIHTHTHAQFPLRSAFDQTHKPLLLYSSSVCFFLSLYFLHVPSLSLWFQILPSQCSWLCSASLLTLFFLSQTLPLSVSLFSSHPPLSLSLSTVVVLVELCIFVLCQCFKSHQSDGISGLSPQLCTIISFCPIQHISELSGPSGNISKNN